MQPSQQARLWYVQRISAAVLALCVLIHLATILYAMQGGISSAEILGRTRGNAVVALFYLLFVVAAAVHAPIGLARISEEWLGWRGRSLNIVMWVLCLLLLGSGVIAVWGLVSGQP
jgi:fumarate reductase subunit C